MECFKYNYLVGITATYEVYPGRTAIMGVLPPTGNCYQKNMTFDCITNLPRLEGLDKCNIKMQKYIKHVAYESSMNITLYLSWENGLPQPGLAQAWNFSGGVNDTWSTEYFQGQTACDQTKEFQVKVQECGTQMTVSGEINPFWFEEKHDHDLGQKLRAQNISKKIQYQNLKSKEKVII